MDEILQSVEQAPEVSYEGVQWKFWHDQALRSGQAQIDVDQSLLDLHHQGHIPAVIRLWRNQPSLVLSRRDARHASFEAVKEHFIQKNIPLYVRTSGGTVVPHGPGVLNISLIFTDNHKKMTLEHSYLLLCDLVRRALAGMGIMAEIRDVPGAFCDGRYNLSIKGKKVGGTAQRIKKHREGHKNFLSHMCLLLDGDPVEICQTIAEFYHHSGMVAPLKSESITTLSRVRGPQRTDEAVLSRLLHSFEELLSIGK